MLYLQILVNGLLLGGLYALIAVGFSLVWGVLNVINILHGTFIVLGSYIAYYAHLYFGVHPFVSVIISGSVLFCLGYVIQAGIINRVIAAPGAPSGERRGDPGDEPDEDFFLPPLDRLEST